MTTVHCGVGSVDPKAARYAIDWRSKTRVESIAVLSRMTVDLLMTAYKRE